jgi:tetratricopeptide (TPR) repeat protein
MKALEGEKYEAAVSAFNRAIAQDPSDYYAHFNLALAYTFLGRDQEGIAEYKKTLELRPKLYEAELNLGILLMRQKRAAEALPLLESAVEAKAGEYRPRYYLGEAQLETGALDKAAQTFRVALGLEDKAPAHLGLAEALARTGKLAEAAPHFKRAAELDPEYKDSLLELAELYEKNGQADEAIAIYREFPSNPGAQERLGSLLLKSKQYDEALQRLEKAYAAAPSDANRYALAHAYVLNGQLDKAAPLLQQLVAAVPTDYGIRMTYGRVLRDRKEYPAAAVQFAEAAKLKAGDTESLNELGAAFYKADDLQPALAAFDRSVAISGQQPGVWFMRAIILDKFKQPKEAVDAYERFLSMSQGVNSDQEWQARQRLRILKQELEKR